MTISEIIKIHSALKAYRDLTAGWYRAAREELEKQYGSIWKDKYTAEDREMLDDLKEQYEAAREAMECFEGANAVIAAEEDEQ